MVITVALAGAMACSAGPRSSAPLSGWAEARRVAESYLRARYGEPPGWVIVSELSGTPFAFAVRSRADLAVAVDAGQVVTARGLAAFDRFLRDSHAIAARSATADELMLLIQQFDAFPPHRNAQGQPAPRDYFHGKHAAPALLPRLDYADDGRAALTVHYRNTDTGDAPGDSGDAMRVFAWTLAIDPAAPMAWSMRVRIWDLAHKQFIDVDHP